MLKFKMMTLGSLLAFSSVSLAFGTQPIVCPDIASIKAEGVTSVIDLENNDSLQTNVRYFAMHNSHYNTDTLWQFVIGPFDGESEDIILKNANVIVNMMASEGILDEDGDCSYIGPFMLAIASPANADLLSKMQKLKA